jgi:hypothetical protein
VQTLTAVAHQTEERQGAGHNVVARDCVAVVEAEALHSKTKASQPCAFHGLKLQGTLAALCYLAQALAAWVRKLEARATTSVLGAAGALPIGMRAGYNFVRVVSYAAIETGRPYEFAGVDVLAEAVLRVLSAYEEVRHYKNNSQVHCKRVVQAGEQRTCSPQRETLQHSQPFWHCMQTRVPSQPSTQPWQARKQRDPTGLVCACVVGVGVRGRSRSNK